MTNSFFNLGVFAVSAVVSAVATQVCVTHALRRNLLDHPNERSSHSQPVPRVGGIGIALGFLLPFLALAHMKHWSAMLAGMVGMAAIGLWDDFRGLVPLRKYVVQLAIAVLLMASGLVVREFSLPYAGTVSLGLLAAPLTLLWLTGFPNFFNFMDGTNGMAGGTAVIYGAFFAVFAYLGGRADLATLGLLLAGSSVGFLFYNFPRARTFMGDTGSLFLGLASAMLVVTMGRNVAPLLILCSVFIYDCVTTIFRRLARREDIFQAHRTHHYQMLARAGWAHARVAWLYFGMHVIAGALGLAYLRGSDAVRLTVVVVDLAMLAGLSFLVSSVKAEEKALAARA